MVDAAALLPVIREMHAAIRDAVLAGCRDESVERLSAVAADEAGDTIYAIDRISEEVLVAHLEVVARQCPLVLMAEGVDPQGLVLPHGTPREHAVFRVIVDPIDGTRGLMYQKRAAWILTGIALERGRATSLRDIEAAIQTEIPVIKQARCDTVWAVRGQGAHAERIDLQTGNTQALPLRPSSATDLAHGYATIVRFFPAGRDVLAAVDEQVMQAVAGAVEAGKATCFEDQYACTGGQLYELLTGHDRFIADLRPLVAPQLASRGRPEPLCCHPYDLCTMLIAEEAGVVLTDAMGRPIDAPLELEPNVAWVGYANAALRCAVEPALQRVLRDHGLIEVTEIKPEAPVKDPR